MDNKSKKYEEFYKIFKNILILLFLKQCYNDFIVFTKRYVFMERMQCDNCGHVYDKDEGDPEHGIAPGTEWAQVPEDYKCPECGATKDKFIIE